ncbi:MAG: hypothetical protein OEW86_03140 [Nitrosopumilus sp.]|nr:hypothetical protein [Nitrosopumilus sp.]MDH3565481.1 hypothetical protein [Nitrosopumilus sp.]MDH5416968.1 hypothetical protein [Nitrosopumilus sp.]MDH5555381.1 hypothetical protein [Nitrosopumilus sp.]
MKQNDVDEILNYISEKFSDEVPGLVKMIVRKKITKLETFEIDSLPLSLRKCTVEKLFVIVKNSLVSGNLKL